MGKWIVTTIVCLIALCGCGGERGAVVFPFDTQADIGRLGQRDVVASISEDVNWNGAPCTKVVYPVGEQEWPALIFEKTALSVNGWKMYRVLTLRIYNPEAKANSALIFQTRDAAGARFDIPLTLNPGWNVLEYAIDDIPAWSEPIVEAHFFTSSEKVERTFYFGPMTLEGPARPDCFGSFEEVFAPFYRLKKADEPQEPAIHKQYLELLRTGEALERQWHTAATENDRFVVLQTMNAMRWRYEGMAEYLSCLADLKAAPDAGIAFFANAVDRIYPEMPPKKNEPVLALARNEKEAIQVCVLTSRDMTGVYAELSAFVAEDGTILPASAFKQSPVGFVNTVQPEYRADYIGWTPDVILESMEKFDAKAFRCYGIYLECFASPEIQPGTYRGKVTLQSDDVPAGFAEMELTVTIHHFTLPERNSLPVAFNTYNEWAVDAWMGTLLVPGSTPDDFREYLDYRYGRREYQTLSENAAAINQALRRIDQMMRDHRIPDENLYNGTPTPVARIKERLEHGAFKAEVMHVNGTNALPVLDEAMKEIQAENLDKQIYVYGFDEAKEPRFEEIREVYGAIRQKYPDVELMTTAIDDSFGLKSGLDDVVDTWVPLTTAYFRNLGAVKAARARGRRVWYYVCMIPRPPSANVLVECPAAGSRLLTGFLAYRSQTDGVLYYHATIWVTNQTVVNADGVAEKKKNHPWPEPLRGGPYTNMNGKSWTDHNGDGMLLYPIPGGALPSLRLKFLRDGLEDYEYMKLLEQAVVAVRSGKEKMSEAWLKQAEDLLLLDDALVKSELVYTRDSSVLLDWRRKIAEALNEYAVSRQ